MDEHDDGRGAKGDDDDEFSEEEEPAPPKKKAAAKAPAKTKTTKASTSKAAPKKAPAKKGKTLVRVCQDVAAGTCADLLGVLAIKVYLK